MVTHVGGAKGIRLSPTNSEPNVTQANEVKQGHEKDKGVSSLPRQLTRSKEAETASSNVALVSPMRPSAVASSQKPPLSSMVSNEDALLVSQPEDVSGEKVC